MLSLAFGTKRGHSCRPFSPWTPAFMFIARGVSFSIPSARRLSSICSNSPSICAFSDGRRLNSHIIPFDCNTQDSTPHPLVYIYIRNTNFEPDFIDKGGKANAERRVDGQISTRYYESRHFRCVRYHYHTPLRHMPLGHVLEKIGSQIHPRGCVVLTVNVTLRGRAGHTMSLHDFPPIFFVKFAFLQQLYCFQYNRAVGTMPLGLTPAYF